MWIIDDDYQKQVQKEANEGQDLGEVIDMAVDCNPSCGCSAWRCNEKEQHRVQLRVERCVGR